MAVSEEESLVLNHPMRKKKAQFCSSSPSSRHSPHPAHDARMGLGHQLPGTAEFG